MAEPLFKTKPVHIETLGDFLAASRKKLNLDTKTVSLLTQIKPAYLDSLEAGSWTKLPSEVYVKGFLKQLASVYGLIENDLVVQFEKERGYEPPAAPQRVGWLKPQININPRTMVVTAGCILVLLTVGYIASQIRSVLAPPLLNLTDPAGDLNLTGSSIVISGQTEIGADVSINNQTVVVDKNGIFTENLILSPGLNVIEVKSINKFGKESRVIRQISASVEPRAAGAGVVNVIVEIGPGNAWIYMEADGLVVQKGTMLAGSSKSASANQDILLTTADAGSTTVIYNGQNLGLLGRRGEVIRNVEFSATVAEEFGQN